MSSKRDRDALAQAGFPCAPSRYDAATKLGYCSASGQLGALRAEALVYSLKRAPIFAGIAEDDLRDIAAFAILKTVAKGNYLALECDVPTGFYIVRRGILNAHRVGVDGREQVMHIFREGESVGESAIAGDNGYPADIRAVVRSEVILIPKIPFIAKMRECPELALRIVGSVGRQLSDLASSLESLRLRDAESRLLDWLYRRCPDGPVEEPATIALEMTKSALAAELGTRHETLSRMFAKLRDDGRIAVSGRNITVLSPRRIHGDLVKAGADA